MLHSSRFHLIWPRLVPFGVLLLLTLGLSSSVSVVHAQRADVVGQPGGAGAMTDTVEARRFDDGRMWTFENPPLDDFEQRYGFRPTQQWLNRARLGALRIPGCSASFVSPAGLVLTNHHCARSHATAVQRKGESIGEEGFYATSLSDERRVPNFYADQLIAIEDVTAEVDRALANAQTDAERSEQRQRSFADIEQRIAADYDDDRVRVDVTPLYNGARHSAYVYRRYTDVRLVFIPENALGYFGGDTDNFTYPRYALDMAFFRVYDDNGEPLTPEHYFQWDTGGAQPNEPVFVVGNPGSTLRLETHDQLAFRRDIQDAHTLQYFQHRAVALQTYLDAQEEAPSALEDELFLMGNVVKLYTGRVEALNDDYIMTRIRKGDAELQSLVQSDAELQPYRGVIDSMRAVQEHKREWAAEAKAFYRIGSPRFESATLARAWAAHAYAKRQQAGASDSLLQTLRSRVTRVPSQPMPLDRRFLTVRLEEMATAFAEDSTLVRQMLRGQSPAQRATALVETSVFADSSTAAAAVAGAPPSDDPMVPLVELLFDRYQTYRSAWNGLQARQQHIARQLGQARYAAYGTDVPPDATFTLRMSDGRVKGYSYNGTVAPSHTTFYGLYGHYHSYGDESEWALPRRWQTPPEAFHRAASLNMVSTNDITGGNSGSPVLNKDLEVVGLAFDGNIESLASDYIYLPGRMRTVSVDVRGMLEALDDLYDADRLVQEVIGGAFVETEASASDAAYVRP